MSEGCEKALLGRGLRFGCASASSSEVLSLPVVWSLAIKIGGDPSASRGEYYGDETPDRWTVGEHLNTIRTCRTSRSNLTKRVSRTWTYL